MYPPVLRNSVHLDMSVQGMHIVIHWIWFIIVYKTFLMNLYYGFLNEPIQMLKDKWLDLIN